MARIAGKERLTDQRIRAWLRKTDTTLHDGAGLYLRRRSGGAYWSLRQVNPLTGERTWAALLPDVPYPLATLAEARTAADKARLLTTEQTDLVRHRKAEQQAKRESEAADELQRQRRITVRQLFERWQRVELAPHARGDGKRSGRKDGGAYSEQQFARRIFPTLGDVAVADVRKADVLAILDAARAEGKLRTANVLLADLKQMFRFALVREVIERNPLDTLTKRDAGGAEGSRERVLTADEIAALAKALPAAKMSRRSELAVWVILATGCRRGELMGARWEHADMVARTWHLPETKNGREHTIHLSDFALDQFAALAALREQGPWVFPSAAGDGPLSVASFGKQLSDRQRAPARRIEGRSKETESLVLRGGRWTAHDLRRTAATLMAQLGISGDVIDECLNHVIESRVRRTYIRDRRPAEQARAFDALGARLHGLAAGVPAASNVVTMRAA